MFIDVTLQKEACVIQEKYRRLGPTEFDRFNRENPETAKEKAGNGVRLSTLTEHVMKKHAPGVALRTYRTNTVSFATVPLRYFM